LFRLQSLKKKEKKGGLESDVRILACKQKDNGARVVQNGREGYEAEQKQHNSQGVGGKEPFSVAVPALTKKTSKMCSPGECAWQEKEYV
jgi:hypothetical protein